MGLGNFLKWLNHVTRIRIIAAYAALLLLLLLGVGKEEGNLINYYAHQMGAKNRCLSRSLVRFEYFIIIPMAVV